MLRVSSIRRQRRSQRTPLVDLFPTERQAFLLVEQREPDEVVRAPFDLLSRF
jgi:hypothetical protein